MTSVWDKDETESIWNVRIRRPDRHFMCVVKESLKFPPQFRSEHIWHFSSLLMSCDDWSTDVLRPYVFIISIKTPSNEPKKYGNDIYDKIYLNLLFYYTG